MKKFIVFLLALVSVVVCLDLAFGLCMDYMRVHAKGGHTRKMETVARMGKHDILIMGSSRANHHYNPQVISSLSGMSAFNTGQEGNGVIMMYGLLELNLQHNTPKILIYDVTPEYDIYVHGDDSDLRYLAFLKPYFHDPAIRKIIGDVAPAERIKLTSSLYRYNSTCLTVANDFIKGQDDPLCGYRPMKGKMAALPEIRAERAELATDPLKLKYFHALIKLAKEKGIRLFAVASPKAGQWDDSVFSPLKALCQAEGVPFLDHYLDEDFSTKPELFNDPVHLNKQGAKLFSAKISEEILQAI